MLQINSGKLYARGVGRTNVLRGVCYSNLSTSEIYKAEIETVAGRLLPTDRVATPSTYLYEVLEQFENEERTGGLVLLSHTIKPYIDDFCHVASFFMRGIVTPEFDICDRFVNRDQRHLSATQPSKLIKRVFDKSVKLTRSDLETFPKKVSDLIALERRSFLAVMKAIRTYNTGILRIAEDVQISYTLMVAAIESLAQNFDNHVGQWDDYEEKKKLAIEKALRGATDKTKNQVKTAILSNEHLALKRRFCEFAMNFLPSGYVHREEIVRPVGIEDLRDALAIAYNIRSRYVHNLAKLPHMLDSDVGYGQTVRDGNEVILTLNGLADIAHAVISEFILRQPKNETEEYEYRPERYGVVTGYMHSEAWIWNENAFAPDAARKWFEAFCCQFADMHSDRRPVTNIDAIMKKIESIIDRSKKDVR